MTPEVLTGLSIKFFGAVFGAALALIFVPPATIQGFFRRLFASVIGGTVFAPYSQSWAGFDPTWEGLLGAACLAGFVMWWLMGTTIRLLRAWEASKTQDSGSDRQTD